jgi:hypothetical protein
MKALLAIALLLLAYATADAEHWVHADLYFRGWYAESFVAVTPQALRDMAAHGYARTFHIRSAPRLQEIVTLLDLPHLRLMRGDPRDDTSLVIDFFDRGGVHTTYRANNRYLYTADCKFGREIDERFRKYFETFAP